MTREKVIYNSEKLPKMNLWRRKLKPTWVRVKSTDLKIHILLAFDQGIISLDQVPKDFTFSRRFREGEVGMSRKGS